MPWTIYEDFILFSVYSTFNLVLILELRSKYKIHHWLFSFEFIFIIHNCQSIVNYIDDLCWSGALQKLNEANTLIHCTRLSFNWSLQHSVVDSSRDYWQAFRVIAIQL